MAKSKPVKKPDTSATPKKVVQDHLSNNQPFYTESFWKRYALPGFVLMVLAVGLYYQSIHYGYVLDDLIVIEENTFTKKGVAGIKEILTTESMTGYFGEQKNLVQGNRYRPLSLVTFAMEYEFHQELKPSTSHFINIILYGLTGLLLCMVL